MPQAARFVYWPREPILQPGRRECIEADRHDRLERAPTRKLARLGPQGSVDRGAVEAARGMGMGELGVIARIELPLAVPTIMSGVRTGAINIIATATIAPLAGVVTLGDFIINRNVYGDEGGDGWVTPERYERLEADGFSGRADPTATTFESLRADLEGYDPALGPAGRELAQAHDARAHAQQLVAAFDEVKPRRDPVDAPLRELARLVRVEAASARRAAASARGRGCGSSRRVRR